MEHQLGIFGINRCFLTLGFKVCCWGEWVSNSAFMDQWSPPHDPWGVGTLSVITAQGCPPAPGTKPQSGVVMYVRHL